MFADFLMPIIHINKNNQLLIENCFQTPEHTLLVSAS